MYSQLLHTHTANMLREPPTGAAASTLRFHLLDYQYHKSTRWNKMESIMCAVQL